jgi:hypothetical protein
MSTPVRVYSDTAAEYRAATEAAAVCDRSDVGRLKATGDDTLDLLNRMSTNRVLDLSPGQGAATILTTDRGRILDLIGVANLGDYVLLLTSPGEQQTVIDWLDRYTIMEDLTVEDITGDTALLTVFGPTSQGPLEAAIGVPLAQIAPYHTASANAYSRRRAPGPNTRRSRPRSVARLVSQRTVYPERVNIRTTDRSPAVTPVSPLVCTVSRQPDLSSLSWQPFAANCLGRLVLTGGLSNRRAASARPVLPPRAAVQVA